MLPKLTENTFKFRYLLSSFMKPAKKNFQKNPSGEKATVVKKQPSASSLSGKGKIRPLLIAGGIALITFLLYIPSFQNDFLKEALRKEKKFYF